jgi:arylsulfatase A-like enzyme
MTGMYQTAIGAHHHRSHSFDHYHLPQGVRPVTHWLRDAGYYTANLQYIDGKPVGTGKTDLNFEVEGEEIWTRPRTPVSGEARSQHNQRNLYRLFHSNEWADLPRNKPFFAQVNLPLVEKRGTAGWMGSGRNPWNKQAHPRRMDPGKVTIPPYYPDYAIVREEWAGYLDAVCGVDERSGEVLRRLETDDLLEDTVVIYFGDNGRLEARGLDWCYDSGDRVPMIIRWPRRFPAPAQYRRGQVSEDVVSLIDITATTLAIAGIARPARMHGRILLGRNADPPRRYAFSARDRCDDAVQRIRAVVAHATGTFATSCRRSRSWRFTGTRMRATRWFA